MIYVTLGTMFLDFPRLVNAVDAIARDTGERVLVQTGMGATLPKHCEHFTFKSREDVLELQRGARAIVCHAGIGCVSDALLVERPLIVVPRLKRFNEHTTDHQTDLARAIEARSWGRAIYDIRDLAPACANPPPAHKHYAPARAPLIAEIKRSIGSLAIGPADTRGGKSFESRRTITEGLPCEEDRMPCARVTGRPARARLRSAPWQ